MDIKICDLCGKPLDYRCRLFKVKELKRVRTEAGIFRKWQTIDIHSNCLKKLLSTKVNPQEAEYRALQGKGESDRSLHE